jgi:tetratricopeptide (TPR) repeat protein
MATGRPQTDAALTSAMRLHEAGRFAEAEKLYRSVLQQNPQHAGALYLFGLLALVTQRTQRGAALLARSIRLNPDFAPAYCNLGIALTTLGRPREALTQYALALSRQPDFADARYNRGVLLKQLGRAEEALEDFNQALALRPDDVEALNNRGLVLDALGKRAEAQADFKRAIALRSDFAAAHCNLGMVSTHLRRPADALACFDRALAFQPDFAEAWCNRGDALHELGRTEDAVASFDKSLALEPALAEAHFGRALSLLLLGRYQEGFQEHEWRHRRAIPAPVRRFPTKPWFGGTDPNGRTLFIHPELYLGDMVQFCRYALLAIERGAHVVMAAQRPLHPLLASLHPAIELIDDSAPPPRFELHCPLLSLPLAFGTTADTVPAPVPYLHADPALAAEWRSRLNGDQLKVGICWQGHPARAELDRSFPVTAFAPVARLSGVRLISLQTGPGLAELADLPAGMAVEHFEDMSDEGLRPFTVLAAMIANLDLVITTDTVVAHIAGAMGRPAWVILKHVADWRWGRSGETTPWYPSLRLFRQQRSGDWDGVFGDVATALAEQRREL